MAAFLTLVTLRSKDFKVFAPEEPFLFHKQTPVYRWDLFSGLLLKHNTNTRQESVSHFVKTADRLSPEGTIKGETLDLQHVN